MKHLLIKNKFAENRLTRVKTSEGLNICAEECKVILKDEKILFVFSGESLTLDREEIINEMRQVLASYDEMKKNGVISNHNVKLKRSKPGSIWDNVSIGFSFSVLQYGEFIREEKFIFKRTLEILKNRCVSCRRSERRVIKITFISLPKEEFKELLNFILGDWRFCDICPFVIKSSEFEDLDIYYNKEVEEYYHKDCAEMVKVSKKERS